MIERHIYNNPEVGVELKDSNIDLFVNNYVSALKSPLVIQNHDPENPVVCRSHEKLVEQRKIALSNYLSGYNNPSAPESNWGRTIFAEWVFTEMFNTAMQPVLPNQQLHTRLATTDIDPSSHAFDTNYRKGGDAVVIDVLSTVKPSPAICILDPTNGSRRTIQRKRSYPGIQPTFDAPVVVVPLRTLQTSYFHNFNDYLDFARGSIVDYGTYIPFYGLSIDEAFNWQRRILKRVNVGAGICREVLKDCPHPVITEQPGIKRVHHHLNYFQNLVNEARNLLL